jgi:hypothetical protein
MKTPKATEYKKKKKKQKTHCKSQKVLVVDKPTHKPEK